VQGKKRGVLKMAKKGIVLGLGVFFLFVGMVAHTQEKVQNRTVSERFIAQVDFSSWIGESFKVSPDSKQVAYRAKIGEKQIVVVDGKEGEQYDGIGKDSLIFSPDSKRVACAAGIGEKWFIVVDGKEGEQYDGIGKDSLIFSPDSKRVACAAKIGKWLISNKWFVVVDGKEGKQYDGIGTDPIFSPDSKWVAYVAQIGEKQFVVVDGKERKQYDSIVTIGGGRIVFDSSDSLHYLAFIKNNIYLIEERIELW